MTTPTHRRAIAWMTGIITAATILTAPPVAAEPGDRLPVPPGPTARPQPPQLTPPTWRRVPRANGDGWVVCRPRATRCRS
ncbi:hypothetical protein ACFVUS_00985 [Nocardia sp. NPDC058058]|uniref:hypothetical protein n=1 Tax=Nocardia sp. NPDC058058 TaxID=3346317 RepID=UPI0036D83EAE